MKRGTLVSLQQVVCEEGKNKGVNGNTTDMLH